MDKYESCNDDNGEDNDDDDDETISTALNPRSVVGSQDPHTSPSIKLMN